MALVHQEGLGPIETGPPAEDGERFDVVVVGGGPGGSAAAIHAGRAGHRVLLIEQAMWPRDKPCGDAVGGKSLRHVTELGVRPALEVGAHMRVTGILFSSPKGHEVRVPLPVDEVTAREGGYVVARARFDHLLFEQMTVVVREAGGRIMQGARVRDLLHDDGAGGEDPGPSSGDARRVTGVRMDHAGASLEVRAGVVIGAGGINCPVARALIRDTYQESMRDRAHACGAWREYWRGVEGVRQEDGELELHFLDDVVPGYLWLFPMAGGLVNVGCGMVLSAMDGRKEKLRALQARVLAEHPRMASRFAQATLVEGSGTGWQLPFGSPRAQAPAGQPRRMFGWGALLIGDAASLVDPFSGEGIGNALLTAEMAVAALRGEDLTDGVSLEAGRAFQTAVWEALGPELTNSFRLQRLVRRRWLLDWFIRKAAKRPALQDALTDMLAAKEAQAKLHSRWFLLRSLLF